MNEVNQLILDCMARVLRINETTDAEVEFRIGGSIPDVSCWGYKRGYAEAVAEQGEKPEPDFKPISESHFCDCIYLSWDGAEERLKRLLVSLDALEKELINAK